MAKSVKMDKYIKANSPCDIELLCIAVNATVIDIIIGIMAILKRNPIIKAIEHINSVNMVSIKANCLLNPSMDGKVSDRVEKFSSLSIPCSIKSMPNMSLK